MMATPALLTEKHLTEFKEIVGPQYVLADERRALRRLIRLQAAQFS